MPIPIYKIALIGTTSVGKTTMITYFTTHRFCETVNTVQASRVKYEMTIRDQTIRLDIWDTAGQERYRTVGPQFFRDAVACIAVYDLTRPESLDQLDGFLSDYKDCFETDGYVVLAANKVDLIEEDLDDALRPGNEYAARLNCSIFATSAKTGLAIEDLFGDVALHLTENPPEQELTATATPFVETEACTC
jgi:small GTP-binding protein